MLSLLLDGFHRLLIPVVDTQRIIATLMGNAVMHIIYSAILLSQGSPDLTNVKKVISGEYIDLLDQILAF